MNSILAFSFYTNSATTQIGSSSSSIGVSSLSTLPLPLVGIPTNNSNNKSSLLDDLHQQQQPHINIHPPNIQIDLTDEEEDLFNLLRTVTADRGMKSTLRVAGGWVRDKILASDEFQQQRDRFEIQEGDLPKAKIRQLQSQQQQSNTRAKSKEEDLELTLQAIMKSPSTTSIISSSASSSSSSSLSMNNKRRNTQSFLSVTEHVDIDITLDDMYGSEFATELNTWLSDHPYATTYTYTPGEIISNPTQSSHLETATMRLNNYWIDFVNLRTEEYSTHPNSDSRIPDVMRIGTPVEDAQRRDLTINSLFYNIHTKQIEDMTGRGLHDLQCGVVDTPLKPLTTLLDDPLRVLRCVRFAARLHFDISDKLWEAACDPSVNVALGRKVSRERIGSEVDKMLKSRDPARALQLLTKMGLIDTILPKPTRQDRKYYRGVYHAGLSLLSTTHDHLVDCMTNRPGWCEAKRALEAGAVNGLEKEETLPLMEDEEARRLLWYAAFLKPLRDRTLAASSGDGEDVVEARKKPRKAKERSAISKLLVDELKRPTKEAESIESIMKAADEFTDLLSSGGSESALAILLSGVRVVISKKQQLGLERGDEDKSMEKRIVCTMDGRSVNVNTESDPVWEHAMEFRGRCANVLKKVEHLWRAAFILSLCEQLVQAAAEEEAAAAAAAAAAAEDSPCIGALEEGWHQEETPEEVICSILKRYDVFAAAMLQLGLIGIWKQRPILDGGEIQGDETILPNLPKGPVFRTIMNEQLSWMISHPGGSREALVEHLRDEFPSYV